MKTVKLSAGDIIEAGCTRCRAVMNHTIVAMVGEQVVKVECNTCHSVHKFREKVEKKVATAAPKDRKTSSVLRPPSRDLISSGSEEWESLSAGMDPARALVYDINGVYRVDDQVAHPVFGLGVVRSIHRPNKMEVLFRQGKKLLRCG